MDERSNSAFPRGKMFLILFHNALAFFDSFYIFSQTKCFFIWCFPKHKNSNDKKPLTLNKKDKKREKPKKSKSAKAL